MHLPTSLLTVGLLWAGHATGFALPPFRKCPTRGTSVPVSEKRADLEALAEQLNPRLGFFDPLRLSDNYFWGFDDKDAVSSIGWLRESEIKHGRIAMAACVGYVVQSSWTWPVPMTLNGMPFPSTELGPPAQWDAISIGLKVQIILLIGLLEIYGEIAPHCANNPPIPHYTKGRQQGYFPLFRGVWNPFLPLNLWDPFDAVSKRTKEQKARGLLCEINNGRLAMIGIMSFLCESKIPGSIPALTGMIKPYNGEVMAPFESNPDILQRIIDFLAN